jgi:hypothetical protein
VGAVVIGFALQDTPGNLFAGLAIPAAPAEPETQQTFLDRVRNFLNL